MTEGTESTGAWTPSDLSTPSEPRADIADAFCGLRAVYRLGYLSMEVPGLPNVLRLGDVFVSQITGPLETQITTIVQEPGLSPVFHKWMEKPFVGAGRHITVLSLEIQVGQDVSESLATCRAKCETVAGVLVALMDERIAEELILEDMTILADDGTVRAVVDERKRVRTYEASHRWFERFEAEIEKVEALDHDEYLRLGAAVRWYHRAVLAGPTAESFVMLWIAIEAAVPAAGGAQSRNEVRAVEEAIAGADPTLDIPADIVPSVGRMAGLRARIVHQGLEDDVELSESWYMLEAITRLLVRNIGRITGGWPFFPDQSMLRDPFSRLKEAPKTFWHAPPIIN